MKKKEPEVLDAVSICRAFPPYTEEEYHHGTWYVKQKEKKKKRKLKRRKEYRRVRK